MNKIIDEVDILLLKSLRENKQLFELTKEIYPNVKGNRGLTDKSIGILHKIRKMINYNFLYNNADGKSKKYHVNKDTVLFLDNATIKARGKKFTFPNLLMLKDNGNWSMMQVST